MTLIDIYICYHQAFFAVIDGHGGQAATDFVAENLGRNITKALECVGGEEGQLEQAIRSGYMVTDKDFLCQVVVMDFHIYYNRMYINLNVSTLCMPS